MAKVWRILSIDGGGIRGIIPATILAAIEERTQKPIAELFDLIAGTSTGGILTLGLTKPTQSGHPEFTAQRLCELYKEELPFIFRNPQSWMGNLLSPKYNASRIQKVLKQWLGDCQLKSALTDVLIPCYDIENRSPHIFRSRWARMQSHHDFLMRDVATATGATPTMFCPARIPIPCADGFLSLVDGGVFANNPAIYAFAEVSAMFLAKKENYLLVSLGTGGATRPLTSASVNFWGYVQWSRPMIELVAESSSESVHAQMSYLLAPTDHQRYYRFQVEFPKHIDYALDNASNDKIQGLFLAAKTFVDDSQTKQELDRLCEVLLRLSSEKAEPIPCYRRAA